MAASRKSPRFLSDDKLLAEFDALSDNDTSNSESESQSETEVNKSGSEGDAEENCDNFDSDSHQEAAQHTKRTARPSFQRQTGNFVPKIHDLANQNSGISANLYGNCSFLYFQIIFFPFQIMQHIAEQINSWFNFMPNSKLLWEVVVS
jgi:hypothetical protein